MCRYSLCFHDACHHFSEVVAEYCEKAEPAVAASSRRLSEFPSSLFLPLLPLLYCPCAYSYPQRGSFSLTFYQGEAHRCPSSPPPHCTRCLPCPVSPLAASASSSPDQTQRSVALYSRLPMNSCSSYLQTIKNRAEARDIVRRRDEGLRGTDESGNLHEQYLVFPALEESSTLTRSTVRPSCSTSRSRAATQTTATSAQMVVA